MTPNPTSSLSCDLPANMTDWFFPVENRKYVTVRKESVLHQIDDVII